MKIIAMLAVLAAGCSDPTSPRGVFIATEPDHADREIVRKWLKENTYTGEWKEVRWWPAYTGVKADRIRTAEDGIREKTALKLRMAEIGRPDMEQDVERDIEVERQWLAKVKTQPREIAIRLKFRSKNAIGGTAIEDTVFLIIDEKATIYRETVGQNWFPD